MHRYGFINIRYGGDSGSEARKDKLGDNLEIFWCDLPGG